MYLALQLAVREQSHSIEQQHHSACAVASENTSIIIDGDIQPLLHSKFCDDWIVQCHFMFAR